jgi:5-methylcytosine-specific restriction endonuclease McrA
MIFGLLMNRRANNRKLKPDILRLHAKGLSYNKIAKALDCSKSVISYHCGNGNEKMRSRNFYKKKDTLQKAIRTKTNSFKSRHLTKLVSSKTKTFKRRTKKTKSIVNNIPEGNYGYKEVLAKIGLNPKCYLTGESIDLYRGDTYEFDHITPISLGGSNDLSNLQIASKKANQAKSSLTVDEFYGLCEKVLEYKKQIEMNDS